MSSGSTNRGGGGSATGRVTGSGADDREHFIRAIVDDFQRQHMGVESEVVAYIVREVVPDEEWQAGITSARINADQVRVILWEVLHHAKTAAESRRMFTIWLPQAVASFEAVVVARHKCPYPFLRC